LANQEPNLLEGPSERSKTGSKHADREHARRKAERKLLEGLSRYYPLKQGQDQCSRSSLLSQSKHRHDFSTHNDLPLTWILLSRGGSGEFPYRSGGL